MALTKANIAMVDGFWISVAGYGAVGDGATNDGPAIQAAINAAPAYGTVYLPEGTYKLDTAITIDKALTFRGERATITTDAGYDTAITVSSNKVDIKDLTFNKQEQTNRFNIVILIQNDQCQIENCFFVGNGETVGEYGRGIAVQFGKGSTTYANLSIRNCIFKNYETCIKTATSKNLHIEGCRFSGGIDPTYATANYGETWLGDAIKCSLDDTDPDGPTDTAYTGIAGLSVVGCTFENMNRDAMDLYYRGSNVTVTGNIFRGSCNKCFDIKVIYDATNTSIPNTRQTRCVNITGNQFFDIAPVNYIIDVITTTDGSVTIDNDNSSQSVVIDSNVFENIDGTILHINNSSFVSFTNNAVRKFDSGSNDEAVIVFEGSDAVMRQFDISNNQIRIFDDAIDLGFIYSPAGTEVIEHLKVCGNTYYGGDDDSFMITRNDGITNFIISNNIVQGNIDTSGQFGGVFITLTDAQVGIISNNVLQWTNTAGVRLDGGYNVRIQNNIIGHCGQTSAQKEIRLEDGTNIATTDRIYIQYNTLHDNGSTTEGVTNNASGANITIANNDTF